MRYIVTCIHFEFEEKAQFISPTTKGSMMHVWNLWGSVSPTRLGTNARGAHLKVSCLKYSIPLSSTL